MSLATGESFDFVYNAKGRLFQLNDSASRQWAYTYDATGNLEFVSFPGGTTKQYHYEDTNYPSALTGITDERGIRYATYEYFADGRAKSSYHGPQTSVLTDRVQGVSITYNDTDGTRTVTNSNGDSSTYDTTVQLGVALVTNITGPGCLTCGVGSRSYIYDPANNNLLSKTENGITTDYGGYDPQGQYGYKIEAVGTLQQRRVDYTYDARFFNKITTITEPSVFASDPTVKCNPATDCKITTNTYDDYGNRLSETVSGYDASGSAVTRTTTWQYGGDGSPECNAVPLHQLCRIDGPRVDLADITTYRYYANDTSQPIGTRARVMEIEDANGVLIRSSMQYTATGNIMSEQRPNGLSLIYTYYPGNDRLQQLTESDGTNSRVTRWTYIPTGEVQTVTTGFGTPDATTLTFGYDNARRLERITDGLGNYIEYTLDTEGNRLAEKIYDSTDALKKQLTQTFDVYSRLDTTAQANESTNPTFSPDGTLDIQTDGQGVVTDYNYDALKRLTQIVQDQGGTDPTTANATTGYDYDVADRVTLVTDPINGNTTYAYDDLGNLRTQISPDTGTTTFTHDEAGNLKTRLDANGQTFIYSYDALNRLTGVDAPGTDDDISYGYDSCIQGTGHLCSVTYGTGQWPAGNQVHYRYNAFGDATQQQGLLYGYDAQGWVQTLDYPSGARLTYSYDAAGQVSQLDFSANNQQAILASNLIYAPFGALTSLSFGNGLTLSQSLDSAYRLTSQNTTGVLERAYPQYDANGNRLSQTDVLASNSSYTYDPLNRLDTGSGPFGDRDFDYDKNGNRVQQIADSVTTSLAYEPNSNRLDTLGATDVLLDTNGNTLNQGNWTYSYNPHNRLGTATEIATLKASFAYNGLGQRIQKIDETTGNGKHYLYGSSGELLVETDEQGNILLEYFYLNGQLIATYSPDDDQDGIPNQQEAQQGTLPINTDSDSDGLTNLSEWFQYGTDSANSDSDGDGITDGVEVAQGSDPNQTSGGSAAGNGDINQSGETNLGDLVLLYQFVIGTRVPTAEELLRADMNQDGLLDTADILLLQQQLLQALLGWTVALAQSPVASTIPSLADWVNSLIPAVQALPNNSGVLYYVHNDPLGTPQALTDESGTVVWTAQTDPFGTATVNEDPDGDGINIQFDIRVSGQYYDSETGLHYNLLRYYDPLTGRYLTNDPIGLAGGLNIYVYVENNPLNYVDPLGLVRWGDAGSSALGLLGNGAGVVVGGALLGTPEPTMATKVVGGAVLAKSIIGWGLNWHNLTRALVDDNASQDAPSSAGRAVAALMCPGNESAERIADAAELTVDFVSGKVIIGSVPQAGSLLNRSVNFSEAQNIGRVTSSPVTKYVDTMQAIQAGQYGSDAVNN